MTLSLCGGKRSACVRVSSRSFSHPIPSILSLLLPLSISSLSSYSLSLSQPYSSPPSLSFFSIYIPREHSTCIPAPQPRLHHGSLPIPPHSRADPHRPSTSNDMSCVRIISTPTSPRWQDGQIVDAMQCHAKPPLWPSFGCVYFIFVGSRFHF